MSYQSVTANARDASRTTSITNLYAGLSANMAKKGTFPLPDAPTVTLTYSGTVIGYQ